MTASSRFPRFAVITAIWLIILAAIITTPPACPLPMVTPSFTGFWMRAHTPPRGEGPWYPAPATRIQIGWQASLPPGRGDLIHFVIDCPAQMPGIAPAPPFSIALNQSPPICPDHPLLLLTYGQSTCRLSV